MVTSSSKRKQSVWLRHLVLNYSCYILAPSGTVFGYFWFKKSGNRGTEWQHWSKVREVSEWTGVRFIRFVLKICTYIALWKACLGVLKVSFFVFVYIQK